MSRAVLLMAHGTPASLDQMPEYLRIVRGGRQPSPELVAEMTRNYSAIGGRSPLTEITEAQASALRSRLGPGVPVAVGMRNWQPFIGQAISTLVSMGADRIVGIPLAPQFSTLSVQKYLDAAAAALPPGVAFEPVRSFHAHPSLLSAFASRIGEAVPQPGEAIVFTAHSLPSRVVASGDGYPREVAETAEGVARVAGIERYVQAYQSAGRTPEPWIGPDLNEIIRTRAAEGIARFLVVPIGFVCDHTEILFDIDVQARATARESGVSLRRTESLNASPAFIDVLEELVREKL
jgi:protoporphyrin/coproporphyrin ferrochelatase